MPSGFKSNCYHCKKIVTSKQRYTTCSLCYLTSHQKCLASDLAMNEYTFVSNNNCTCQNCATEVFPFHSLSDKELTEEFFSGFEINASLLNEIFTESGQLTNCDIDFNNDEEISDNMIKEVYISAKEVNEFLENPGENIDELQLTSSFSRQKHWTAKRASFFYSVHALNMKRCGVSGGRDGRV